MMKSLLCQCLLVSLFVGSQASAIREVQNGGGGLVNQGRYMTYYSANIPIVKDPLEVNQIPGLTYLLNKVKQLNVDEGSRAQLMASIFPTNGRRYYTADASQISDSLRKSITDTYAGLMHVPANEVVLFALTNSASQDTLLMPEFFKMLNESEQAAILFHESLWLTGPEITYSDVIAAEQQAQAFFDNPQDPKKYSAFYNMLSVVLDQPQLALQATFTYDQKVALPWGTQKNKGRFLLSSLFGEKYLRCYFGYVAATRPPESNPGICADILFNETITFYQSHPESLFLQAMVDYLRTNKSIVIQTWNSPAAGGNNDYASGLSDAALTVYLKHLYGRATTEGDFAFKLETENGTNAGILRF